MMVEAMVIETDKNFTKEEIKRMIKLTIGIEKKDKSRIIGVHLTDCSVLRNLSPEEVKEFFMSCGMDGKKFHYQKIPIEPANDRPDYVG